MRWHLLKLVNDGCLVMGRPWLVSGLDPVAESSSQSNWIPVKKAKELEKDPFLELGYGDEELSPLRCECYRIAS